MPRLISLIYHRRPTTLFIENAYFAGESPDYPKVEALPSRSEQPCLGCSAMTMLNMDRMASAALRQIKRRASLGLVSQRQQSRRIGTRNRFAPTEWPQFIIKK